MDGNIYNRFIDGNESFRESLKKLIKEVLLERDDIKTDIVKIEEDINQLKISIDCLEQMLDFHSHDIGKIADKLDEYLRVFYIPKEDIVPPPNFLDWACLY